MHKRQIQLDRSWVKEQGRPKWDGVDCERDKTGLEAVAVEHGRCAEPDVPGADAPAAGTVARYLALGPRMDRKVK